VGADAATPLYDMSARFYDPNLGAFTQLDSYAGQAQDPMSLNRYLYAAANPATLIDPDGHFYMAAEGLGGVGAVRTPTARQATHNTRVQRYWALDQAQCKRSQSMTSGATGQDLRASDLRTQMVSKRCAVDCSRAEPNTFLDAAAAFALNAVISTAFVAAVAATCAASAGVARVAAVGVGAFAAAKGTVETAQTVFDPTVSDHDRWVAGAGWAGGLTGGGFAAGKMHSVREAPVVALPIRFQEVWNSRRPLSRSKWHNCNRATPR
jgi:RHS repeat-associated protein